MPDATIGDVCKFFEYPEGDMKSFRTDWASLTDQDKADLKKGIGDGTLDY